MRALILFAVLLASAATFAGEDSADLESRSRDGTATAEGKAYEPLAMGAFFGDLEFMKTCAPSGAEPPNSVLILYEVLPDGALGAVSVTPMSPIAECIKTSVASRHFPLPPGREPWVGKIELSFTE